MTSESAFLYTYGTYLSRGGTPQTFQDLTPEDIQLMYTVYTAEERRKESALLSGMAKILGKMFGGEE